jgi:hypothetical protein
MVEPQTRKPDLEARRLGIERERALRQARVAPFLGPADVDEEEGAGAGGIMRLAWRQDGRHLRLRPARQYENRRSRDQDAAVQDGINVIARSASDEAIQGNVEPSIWIASLRSQ